MTAITISGETALEAWIAGAMAVLHAEQLTNVVTTISNPCDLEDDWLDDYSPSQVSQRFDNIRDVVNTVFPVDLARRCTTPKELYSRYLALHDRAKRLRRNRSTWGTYFERLIRFPRSEVNQLDRSIQKLCTWNVRSATALVFHLSSPAIDAPRTRGGPCWQYGELLWHQDDKLSLVAVYRNHDFFNKTLGNFLGLGQLLKYICEQTAKQPQEVICHSVHAYNGGTKTALRRLVRPPSER